VKGLVHVPPATHDVPNLNERKGEYALVAVKGHHRKKKKNAASTNYKRHNGYKDCELSKDPHLTWTSGNDNDDEFSTIQIVHHVISHKIIIRVRHYFLIES